VVGTDIPAPAETEQFLLVIGDFVALRIAERKSITDLGSLWALHANLE